MGWFRRRQKPQGHLIVHVRRDGALGGLEVKSPLAPEEVEPALSAALFEISRLCAQARERRVEALLVEGKKRAGLFDKLRGRAKERIEAARQAVLAELFSGASKGGEVVVTLDGAFGFQALRVAEGTVLDAAWQGLLEAHAAALAAVEKAWHDQIEEAKEQAAAEEGEATKPASEQG